MVVAIDSEIYEDFKSGLQDSSLLRTPCTMFTVRGPTLKIFVGVIQNLLGYFQMILKCISRD